MNTIDRGSDRPAYKQLADILRNHIINGDLAEELPSENDLAKQHAVSLTTVRQATALLRTEGLIVTSRGRRNRVRPVRITAAQRYRRGRENYGADNEGFSAEHGVAWNEFDVTREIAVEPCPPRVAGRLDIAPGSDVYARRFIHSTGGIVLRASVSYLRMEFAGTDLVDPDADMAPGGTIRQLQEMGIQVVRVAQEIQIRRATSREATALHLAGEAWVMESFRSMHPLSGAAVECALHIYPPDRGHILAFETNVIEPPAGSYD